METFLHEHGLAALFALSFLASTLIPLGSEWLLVLVLLDGANPVAALAVATAGNTLGAGTSYALGRWGGVWVARRWLRMTDLDLARGEAFFKRWGAWSLLFSWLPFVGDPLCVVGGLFRLRWWVFFALVFTGKLVRYAVVVAAVLAAGGGRGGN
jgi:membrane protein YqaA with SNARE-associated domain